MAATRFSLTTTRGLTTTRRLLLSQSSSPIRLALAAAPLPPPLLQRSSSSSPSPSLPLSLARLYSASSSTPTPTPSETTNTNTTTKKRQSPEEKLGLSARLKSLFRKHGWTALAIYLFLSLLDFTLTFLFIYAIGADKVRKAEDWVLVQLGWRRVDGEMGRMRRVVEEWKENHPRVTKGVKGKIGAEEREQTKTEGPRPVDQTVDKLEEERGYSSIATTAVLAYAIHKTLLLPLRVGVTVSSFGSVALSFSLTS